MFEHAYIQLSEVRLHYVTAGTGPLVVLLHGFPEFCYSWRRQIPELARRYRVVAPDMRGYNLSDKPRGVSAYRSRRVAQDIAELIAARGEGSARVVGHDWGGAITWLLAAYHPEVVERLVVLNCPHPNLMARQLKTNRAQLRRSWYIFFFQLPWLPELWLRKNLRKVLRGERRGAFTSEDRELYEEAFARPGAATAAINYYRAALREQLLHPIRLPPITRPTTLIWGERDRALGIETTHGTEQMVAAPFRMVTLPHAGHWVNQDEPEEVNRLLLEALA